MRRSDVFTPHRLSISCSALFKLCVSNRWLTRALRGDHPLHSAPLHDGFPHKWAKLLHPQSTCLLLEVVLVQLLEVERFFQFRIILSAIDACSQSYFPGIITVTIFRKCNGMIFHSYRGAEAVWWNLTPSPRHGNGVMQVCCRSYSTK